TRSGEIVLALHPPVEQRRALEQRGDRGGGFGEVLVEVRRLRAASACNERGVRPIPPLDDPGMKLSRAGDHAVECCARNLAKAAAARRLAVTDETGRGAGGGDDRVTEEVESGALAPTVGQASRPHLRGT